MCYRQRALTALSTRLVLDAMQPSPLRLRFAALRFRPPLLPLRLPRVVALGLLGSVLVFAAGCRPAEEWNIVRAKSGLEFQQWRAGAIHRLTQAERDEVDAMVDELRWSATPPLTKEAVYALIDRKPYTEVVRLGYEARIRRVDPLWGELKAAVDNNALLVTREGDPETAATLRHYRRDQLARLEKMSAEIHQAEKRVAELTGRPHTTRPREATPAALSRAEGLRQIDDLIARRREAARSRFGDWPVKFDPNGSGLSAAAREDFDRRQTRAKIEGRTILAVHVRDKWWVYDAPKEEPAVPPAVVANLTDLDRRQLEAKWLALQAELWAREQSRNEAKEAREAFTTPTPPKIEAFAPTH